MFERYFNRYSSTIDLLDDFEDSGEEEMLLKEAFSFFYEWKDEDSGHAVLTSVNLHILNPRQNSDSQKYYPYFYSNFTMTELKELAIARMIHLNALEVLNQLEYKHIPKISLATYLFLNRNKELFQCAIREMDKNKTSINEQILFDKPLRLNAQNSNNRDGSSSYLGYNPHGKTSDYYITGFSLSCDRY